jgi:hypothetical protein
MEDTDMGYFLANLLSPLLLPVFILMLLGAMAGGKPETIAKAFLDLIGTVTVAVCRILGELIGLISDLLLKKHSYGHGTTHTGSSSKFPQRHRRTTGSTSSSTAGDS